MAISTIAMIVFFGGYAIESLTNVSLWLVVPIAAAVAAIALAARR